MPLRAPLPPLPDAHANDGLAPVYRRDARVQVQGSFPGRLSLSQQQYYAHPRNQFWPIFSEIAGAAPALPYAARLQRLLARQIALWDVLSACVRVGSLDSNIRAAQPNEFAALLARLPAVERVLLNGSEASTLFARHVLPTLTGTMRDLPALRMPSTSPAHARMPIAAKLQAWQLGFDGELALQR